MEREGDGVSKNSKPKIACRTFAHILAYFTALATATLQLKNGILIDALGPGKLSTSATQEPTKREERGERMRIRMINRKTGETESGGATER